MADSLIAAPRTARPPTGVRRAMIAHELVTVKRAYIEQSSSFWGKPKTSDRGR